MQRNPSQGNNYHIIVRLTDQHPVLIPHSSSEDKLSRLQKHNLDNSHSSDKRILAGVFSTINDKHTTQPLTTQTQTFSCNINLSNTAGKTEVKEQTKYGQLKKTKDTEREGGAKNSIISELIALSCGGQEQTFKFEHFNGLESIQCIECTSIHEGDSYDFEQADSEIMSLTHEEKQFFHKFITPDLTEKKQMEELFNKLSLQTTQVVPQTTAESLPQNKLKVIRNFFKPKEITGQVQKNHCDSITFLEKMVSNLKGNQNPNHMGQIRNYNKSK